MVLPHTTPRTRTKNTFGYKHTSAPLLVVPSAERIFIRYRVGDVFKWLVGVFLGPETDPSCPVLRDAIGVKATVDKTLERPLVRGVIGGGGRRGLLISIKLE
jgi:hypothetical protein